MSNPLSKEHLKPQAILQALSEIGGDIDTTRQHTEEYERTGRIDAEMAMSLALSGLEIKLTNFTQELRLKLL